MPLYRTALYAVRLVRDADVFYTLPTQCPVSCSEKAAGAVAALLRHADREHFIVCLFDVRRRLIGVHTAHVGTLTGAAVHPREIFKVAILTNAHSIILAHNHPSGDVQPSQEDYCITRKCVEAGHMLNISVTDHIVVGFPADQTTYIYYSFAEQGKLN